ncbi:hypothetical protein Kpol_1003p21 [Vanderwaltozyma polyspora DSM 70294]|uniref:Uncharacterized protein n=1 Tax=Vanderwaltozyma polyspora (strain ATCC 22028 / DSM 70294 / BCRC 21397 / CBS 2163 / NBRC 10782 / NRRL Y-8283 / UCD 57-17) TaxID=436907 RepID=A7TLX9_VANPO|nr:uncharacterized protein Kpol_1003p21 [Vanderwaltozyma polyspora DSM 70294]EDO16716.1 hypothetical protein Kpol_1003p21 [Vanderwaltozyma polyspora DSM 70294]
MSELKVVSRKDVFQDDDAGEMSIDNETVEETAYQLPASELFEMVEVEPSTTDLKEEEEENDEFEFPLFSFGTTQDTTTEDKSETTDGVEVENGEEERGRSKNKLMKISLREPSPEIINQERPKEYYFHIYDEEEQEKYKSSAIDYDSIFVDKDFIVQKPGNKNRVIDITKKNDQVEKELLREKMLKKRRPSKKQRVAKKLALERIKAREELAKQLKKEAKKKLGRRGGKKNKKKEKMNPLANAGATPRFRTE